MVDHITIDNALTVSVLVLFSVFVLALYWMYKDSLKNRRKIRGIIAAQKALDDHLNRLAKERSDSSGV